MRKPKLTQAVGFDAGNVKASTARGRGLDAIIGDSETKTQGDKNTRSAGRPRGPDKIKHAIYLTPETSKALRHAAVDAGKTITELVADAVAAFLKSK